MNHMFGIESACIDFGVLQGRGISHMKKFIFVLTLCFGIVFCETISFAEIAQNRIAIGGIGYGSSMEYVNSVYGQPTDEYHKNANWNGKNVDVYLNKYGKRFSVVFLRYEKTAIDIMTTGSDLSTPDGVTVGMSADILNAMYGQADSVRSAYGGELYGYIGVLPSGEYSMLEFDVREGLITEIEIHIRH